MMTEDQQLVHRNIEHLHGPEEITYAEDELVVVCLVRDGRPYLKSFVEHYFSLGVKHIVFLDNGSVDGTVSAALSYDNVTILQTDLPFKEHKNSMRQYLVARFGRGRWILYVDIDELFDYPYSDVVSLSSFLRHLTKQSYTAVVAQMLYMLPEKAALTAGARKDEPLKELHRFYDTSHVTMDDYESYNTVKQLNNMLASDQIGVYRNGINRALFGHNALLTKHPLIFVDEEVRPFVCSEHYGSEHYVSGARVADTTCVLFHYKFIGDFYDRVVRAVKEENYSYNSSKYKKFLETLKQSPNLQVKLESARELKNVNDLVENQFLVVSEEYMTLVYEEELKGDGHTPRSQPGQPEDEAAFHRARAKAKVQSLKARRLEQQLREQNRTLEKLREQNRTLEKLREQNRTLEKLREQNQKLRRHKRGLEKLREQYQRRIKKLRRRLASTKKRTKKKNRMLTNRLRSLRASRSWRLLNKLGRLRARVLAGREGGPTSGAVSDDRHKKQAQKLKIARQKDRDLTKEQRKKIKEQNRPLSHARRRINEDRKKSAQKKQEIFRVKNELPVAQERVEGAIKDRPAPQAGGEPNTSALPNFVDTGAHEGAAITSAGPSGPNSLSIDVPRLIVRPTSGLGNRMRVVSSFQRLARHSGRVFELCWAPSSGWSEEDLSSLFENDFPRVSLDEFERYCQNGLDLHNAVRVIGPSSDRTWEWREGSGIHQIFDLAAFPVVTYSGMHRCEWLVDPSARARLFPDFESDYQASLKEWRPVPSIRADLERLAAHFGPHTVGVHIRRGDAWSDAKGRPRPEYRRSTDAAFIARMDAELAAEPRTNFFLATDCAATEERFCERYGEVVMVNRNKRFVPSVPGQPKDNQRDAVIDMFALARTRKILGNNYSSFSRMAAGIGGIRFHKVLED